MISFSDATATGVPPRVPTFEIDGTDFVRRTSFDSAAFTNPTGVPTQFFLRDPVFSSAETASWKTSNRAFGMEAIGDCGGSDGYLFVLGGEGVI